MEPDGRETGEWNLGSHWDEALKTAIGAAVVFVFGWVVSALQTRKRFEEFDAKVVQPLRSEIAALKGAAGTYVTREELERTINSLRHDLEKWMSELKQDIRDLRK